MTDPKPQPPTNSRLITDSSDAILIIAEGEEDLTERPRRPKIPRGWPGRETEDSLPPAAEQDGNPVSK
jgi:hypothetical protein